MSKINGINWGEMKSYDTRGRIHLRSILACTDFSKAAAGALPYAAALAQRFEAKLYAIHVRPPVVNPMTQPAYWPPLEEAAKTQRLQWKEELLNITNFISETVGAGYSKCREFQTGSGIISQMKAR